VVQERHAAIQRAGGEVLGQLDAHHGVGHDTGRGDQPLGLAADVRGVPRRPAGSQPGQYSAHRLLPVERADRAGDQVDRAGRVAVAEGGQLGPPAFLQPDPGLGSDLVRAAVGPRPGVPRAAQRRAGGFTGVRRGPFPFVAVHIPGDLRVPGTERPRVLGELPYFSRSVLPVAVRGE
jgi:hypothetical protein